MSRERTYTWTDPLVLALEAAGHTGLGWLELMKKGDLPPPPVMETLGLRPEELEEGRIVFSMRAEEWMSNPAGVVHGGMAATILDTVLTLAIVSKLPKGKTAQTIQMNLHYVRPLFPNGKIALAEGLAVHVGSTIGTAEGRLLNADGKLVAHGSATLAVMDIAAMATRYPKAP